MENFSNDLVMLDMIYGELYPMSKIITKMIEDIEYDEDKKAKNLKKIVMKNLKKLTK